MKIKSEAVSRNPANSAAATKSVPAPAFAVNRAADAAIPQRMLDARAIKSQAIGNRAPVSAKLSAPESEVASN
jgi:hypothetical protein